MTSFCPKKEDSPPPPDLKNCCKGQTDRSVNDPAVPKKLQAEIVSFRILIRVTEKQVVSSPKSELIYFFVYSFITKRIIRKVIKI